jgi:hypothetical protein
MEYCKSTSTGQHRFLLLESLFREEEDEDRGKGRKDEGRKK